MHLLGIDIGGSGIKGAPVDTDTGQLLQPRFRIATPEGAKPKDVAEVVHELVQHFTWQGGVGCGFPSVVHNGIVYSAANIHKSWVGMDADALFEQITGLSVHVINDADAAGLAEMRYGAGKDQPGVVMMITVGTGLGSALFMDGKLVPNTELGHLEMNGHDAEERASDAARQRDDLSWKKWGKRFNLYLQTLERLFWPDLFIIGGGAVKNFESFSNQLEVRARVLPATLQNEAGIVGAALAARQAQ